MVHGSEVCGKQSTPAYGVVSYSWGGQCPPLPSSAYRWAQPTLLFPSFDVGRSSLTSPILRFSLASFVVCPLVTGYKNAGGPGGWEA